MTHIRRPMAVILEWTYDRDLQRRIPVVPKRGSVRALSPVHVWCEAADAVSTMSLRHWNERATNPAIDGQVARLPEGVCGECVARIPISVEAR